jgi:hypothetical protein
MTFVKGVETGHRSALIFENIDALASRFRKLYDALSPIGICNNRLAQALTESRKAPPPQKLSTSILGYPRTIDRNKLANEIEWVLRLVWDMTTEVGGEEDILRRCYVIPEATRNALELTKELLAQRRHLEEVPRLAEVHPPEDVIHMIQGEYPEKPIIVLGRVGHGKTTFLQYLRLIEAKDHLDNYIQVEIDFLDRPSKAEEVQGYVFEAVDKQVFERYGIDLFEAEFSRHALDGELRRFRRTPKGNRFPRGSAEQKEAEDHFIVKYQEDKHRYLTAAVRHLRRSHHKAVAIFFDNLDRREKQSLQEEAFRLASAVAREWEALVFICLRPGTFYRSVTAGTLDAVAPRTILVSPPRPDVVLKKRFELAREIAAGQTLRAKRLAAMSFGRNISAELPTAAQFFECCRVSFAHKRRLTQVFAAVSQGDMRLLLRLVKDYLTSQHLDTRKILGKLGAGGYRLATHEAIRALMYSSYRDYDPTRSVFPNVFDIEHGDGLEHFCRLLALRACLRWHQFAGMVCRWGKHGYQLPYRPHGRAMVAC